MSEMVSEIWLIVPDRGYEGLGEPLMAFLSEEHAKLAQLMMQNDLAASSTKILKCPVWKSA